MKTAYAIALGSNRRHVRYGAPHRVLAAALDRIDSKSVRVRGRSPALLNPPLGPSPRQYANAAAIVESRLDPPELLAKLKKIERKFGRRPGGTRWSARVLDLDIILWSGGAWASPDVTIPHPHFRGRRFVLDTLARIAPDWRDPLSNLTVRHLKARLDRKRPAA